MNSLQKLLAAIALEASSLVLSFTTGIFGAAGLVIQLRILTLKQFVFFQLAVVSLLLAFQMIGLSVVVLTLGCLVFIYTALKQKSLFWRGFFSSIASTIIILAVIYFWIVHVEGKLLWPYLIEMLQFYLNKAKTISLPLETSVVVYQLPSYIFCICSLNVWIAALFEKRFSVEIQSEIHNFTVPGTTIWFVIASLFFSFVKVGIPGVQEVALNILNISLLLYFFQGLSVLSFILSAMRFSTLIKWVIYFIFVLQILLPICLGIIDYWLDLRSKLRDRLNKKSENPEDDQRNDPSEF